MKFSNMNDWHSDPAREAAGVPFPLGGERVLIVRRTGARNREFMAALADVDFEDVKVQRSIVARTLVVGWRGIKDASGADVAFSPDACVELFEFAPDLLDAVTKFAHVRGNFQAEEIEREKDDLKN